jgi:hypothetical protein
MPQFWDNKGLTVIEAVAATAILFIGIAGVGVMFRVSMMNDRSSVTSRTSDTIAMEVAEQIRGELASSEIITFVSNLANVQLTDPNFQKLGNSNPVPDCPGGVNCVEQYGTYRGYNYKWRLDDQPDPAEVLRLVPPLERRYPQWSNAWRLRVTIGWEDCKNPPGSCTDMGGGRWSYRSTQVVTFVVPPMP